MLRRILLIIFASLTFGGVLQAQDSLRYYRLYLHDKGVAPRSLSSDDPLYKTATAHLTERALARRAKVLPADQLVTTDDLPIHQPYLDRIVATGATVKTMSRWLNTVMLYTDSVTYKKVRDLAFLDSIDVVRTHKTPAAGDPFGKITAQSQAPSELSPQISSSCVTSFYGLATTQNRLMKYGFAHSIGIAGEGVLVGVLDAGFDWRHHVALQNADIRGEYDFVYGDSITEDLPGETSSEYHGTTVMSCIGAYWPGRFIGGAPNASFLLARTEDVRSERHVEEDYYVAGLEWLEAQGVDVTNASLGYTNFDSPEQGHSYRELDGRTAFASRGLNHCVRLGVVCVNAAGNDYLSGFKYVGVPAEADSAIAVAAVDSTGTIASFSSRGFAPGSSLVEMTRPRSLKPDVAGMGVKVYGVDPKDSVSFASAQGTSLASPLVTASIALILSARPDLTPYQLRKLLTETASRADAPDTAYGYGLVDVERALRRLSEERPLVGFPAIALLENAVSIGAWIEYPATRRTDRLFDLTATSLSTGQSATTAAGAPVSGVAQWTLPLTPAFTLRRGDSIEVLISSRADGIILRRSRLMISEGYGLPRTTMCADIVGTATDISEIVPNPFGSFTTIGFTLSSESTVGLHVYNTLGQVVATLYDSVRLPAGHHTAVFDAKGLPAGVYHAALTTGGAPHSSRLLYLPAQ